MWLDSHGPPSIEVLLLWPILFLFSFPLSETTKGANPIHTRAAVLLLLQRHFLPSHDDDDDVVEYEWTIYSFTILLSVHSGIHGFLKHQESFFQLEINMNTLYTPHKIFNMYITL